MTLFQLTFSKDEPWKTVEAMLQLDYMHFEDLNSKALPMDVPYADEIRKCDESLRQLATIEKICKDYGIRQTAPQTYQHL